jgi:hypothetical protein
MRAPIVWTWLAHCRRCSRVEAFDSDVLERRRQHTLNVAKQP